MTQADSVLSTPPTNTSATDPTRRRFLAVAAVGSMVAGTSVAAAASVPQAAPSGSPSPALRSAVAELARAHASLLAAEAKNDAAEALFDEFERSHPRPKSKRAIRKWIKRMSAYHRKVTPEGWQFLMTAELVFAKAQCDVALVPIESAADLHAMAAASVTYDKVDLARHNRAPIALMVADEIARRGSAVQS